MQVNIICPESALNRLKNCLPGESARIGEIEFSMNGTETHYDGIVVLQSTSRYDYEALYCRDGNSLLVVREPQDILRMTSKYVKQFDHVLTPNSKVKGIKTIRSQYGQLWSFDRSYQSMVSMCPPDKIHDFSTVTSIKAVNRGHRTRVKILRNIQEELKFDWYGRGVKEIEDKWDAIAPYKYSLVFENGRWPDYWTEKLSDAFLGFCLPVYIGCTNIKDYFPEKSLVLLDDRNPDTIVRQLTKLVDDDAYARAFNHIVSARDKVIHEYSLFNVLNKIIRQYFNMNKTSYKHIDLRVFENIVNRYSIKSLKHSIKAMIRMR